MNRYRQLLHQFQRELQLLKYADSTVRTYTDCLAIFLRAMNGKPNPLPLDEIKTFLLTIKNANYHKQFTATIHHFYSKVLKQPLTLHDIPYPRKTHYLPQIFSVAEVYRFLQAIPNLKQKTALQLMYSCALRISEVVNIQLHHVDGQRQLLLVKGAKGFKDRYVPIPLPTIAMLRQYYTQYRPSVYLFNGQNAAQYDVRSIQQVFHRAKQAAGIIKKLTPHCLRHSRLTHLKEAGVDIHELKEIAGHNNIKTTEIYLHLAKETLVRRMAMADQYLQSSMQNSKVLAPSTY
ncbi:MAG: hypothetical protein EOO14_00400 [Chitinophagaceae bacterium]|nr:MAG: hypothetical protein EOO14_00400 [Chitinophagaceae bacterium]